MPQLICAKKEIPEGKSKKFPLKDRDGTQEGFVIRHRGGYFAYLNRCAHVSLSLDWGDNDFFTADGKFLACKNHGALYLPQSGECVAGPCSGLSLEKLPLRIIGKDIFIDLP